MSNGKGIQRSQSFKKYQLRINYIKKKLKGSKKYCKIKNAVQKSNKIDLN